MQQILQSVLVVWNYHMEYYADELSTTKLSKEKEDTLQDRYQRIKKDHTILGDSPCTVVDAGGKILVWCLPELFSQARQVLSQFDS